MAVIDISYMSRYLKRYVDVKVILPIEDTKELKPLPVKVTPFPTLYLLHGYSGNCNDWMYGSRIFKLARDLKLAVVMPSGENHFYVDQPEADMMYASFIGEELVDATRKMFPLSTRKEDTFIGGLSMGGYGSLLIGSRFTGIFSKIFALSAPQVIDEALMEKFPLPRTFFTLHFGDLSHFDTCSNNPVYVASRAYAAGTLPPLWFAIGKEDPFFENSMAGIRALQQVGIPLTVSTPSGGHEWSFWDVQIEPAIHWCLDRKL